MERKSKALLWFFVVTFISFSSGCISCQYYNSYQPKAVDWNMHGEATEWKGIQPYETEKMASKAWQVTGILLVMLSPVFGWFAGFFMARYEDFSFKKQQGSEREVWAKSLENLSLEELEKELQKAKFEKNWQNLAYSSESPKIIAEMEKRIPILERMIEKR